MYYKLMEFFKRHKNDILLIAAALALAAGAWLILLAARSDGGEAVVLIDGVETARYPLDEDTVEIIDTGRGVNTLVISGGAASVTEADCPDKVCVRRGAVRYEGETIVCLPHRLVVEIWGGDSSGVDAVAD